MNTLLLPTLLITIESLVYLIIGNCLNIPLELSIRTLVLYLIFMFTYGHYSQRTTLIWDEMKNVAKAMFLYFIAIFMFVSVDTYPLSIFLYGCISVSMFLFAIGLSRFLRVKLRSYIARRTLVIGTGKEAVRYLDITKNNRFALTKVVGMVSLDATPKFGGKLFETQTISSKHINLGQYGYYQLDEVILKKRINQIVIILPDVERKITEEVMRDVNGKVRHIKFFVEGTGLITFSSVVQDFDGLLLVSTSRSTMSILDRILKRTVDILAGLVGCLINIPLALMIKYKYVKNGDKDPIIFCQDRIGKDGKTIKIYKFRTMIPNAEAVLEKLMDENPSIKKEYLINKKLRNDPRITPLGNKLRNSSLDEFPQFINVLKGEMSLVGPRPYLFREKEDMDIYFDAIVSCKPGITGMWQANGRSDVGFEDRCKLDDYYYNNWSVSLDFVIIYKTVKGVFYGKGAL
ncbi:exopolysaccharide biosynthesis polyprenyl glycosylphosphotransferase [Tannockella kyphosi]|uniref:exopolysaccharide biosynthesis polyprenyl glycosylphosphotransferase n=1 Tax=Tannockella kyphosi TaxID=2899121 RepID=UPI002010CB63|nr:exopolysaccharide biosynthesis polyprenyl glycosylphosphotransferase [Tannockella kyphosi]